MTAFYFSYFPQINYGSANNLCLNLTKNVSIRADIKGQTVLFYPFEIPNGMRSDALAYSYYNDSYFEWLIFLANGMTDPYYGWNLTDDEFNSFLIKKYGSVEFTQQHVKYYQVDWAEDFSSLSPSQFQNELPEVFKKYYSPVFGQGSKVLYWQRNRDDWITNTNQIVRVEISPSNNTDFITNELVVFQSNGVTIGNAEIIVSNTSVAKIQHVFGNTSSNTSVMVGLTSNAHANVTDSSVVDYVIPLAEFAFWEPVFIYDWEKGKNEKNKNIYLIDSRYAPQIAETFRLNMKAAANTVQ